MHEAAGAAEEAPDRDARAAGADRDAPARKRTQAQPHTLQQAHAGSIAHAAAGSIAMSARRAKTSCNCDGGETCGLQLIGSDTTHSRGACKGRVDYLGKCKKCGPRCTCDGGSECGKWLATKTDRHSKGGCTGPRDLKGKCTACGPRCRCDGGTTCGLRRDGQAAHKPGACAKAKHKDSMCKGCQPLSLCACDGGENCGRHLRKRPHGTQCITKVKNAGEICTSCTPSRCECERGKTCSYAKFCCGRDDGPLILTTEHGASRVCIGCTEQYTSFNNHGLCPRDKAVKATQPIATMLNKLAIAESAAQHTDAVEQCFYDYPEWCLRYAVDIRHDAISINVLPGMPNLGLTSAVSALLQLMIHTNKDVKHGEGSASCGTAYHHILTTCHAGTHEQVNPLTLLYNLYKSCPCLEPGRATNVLQGWNEIVAQIMPNHQAQHLFGTVLNHGETLEHDSLVYSVVPQLRSQSAACRLVNTTKPTETPFERRYARSMRLGSSKQRSVRLCSVRLDT